MRAEQLIKLEVSRGVDAVIMRAGQLIKLGREKACTVWLQYFEGLNFCSLRVNPLFENFRGIYFRCMHCHLLVTE